MINKELFSAVPIAANGTLNLTPFSGIGGFIADVSGALTLTISGVAVLSAVPVAAGEFYKLPFGIPPYGVNTLVLAGGAKGCAAVVA